MNFFVRCQLKGWAGAAHGSPSHALPVGPRCRAALQRYPRVCRADRRVGTQVLECNLNIRMSQGLAYYMGVEI